MFGLRVAVLSDIHGNRWALESVLEDILRKGISDLVNLGDVFYGPLDPSGTAHLLKDFSIPTVRGNQDRVLMEPPDGDDINPTLEYVLQSLQSDTIQWLNGLEKTAVVEDTYFLCHGTPERDDAYLLQEVGETSVSLRKPSDLLALLSPVDQPVILCGHDHLSRTVLLPDGRLIVNPGSVGLPAYEDDLPFSHVMETGTPHARYSVVSKSKTGWQVEDIAVPYDWEGAASAAMKCDRPDWAEWLRTGRAETQS